MSNALLFGFSFHIYLPPSNQVIEPLVSKQWFVTMEPLAEEALQAVEKGELTIMPERFEKVFMILLISWHISTPAIFCSF